uniref:Reverse transcriptase domain-containing protein n=1 Tax=Anolis carolinensis TaxID=28377 RepID=A0A803U0W5_ANOCA
MMILPKILFLFQILPFNIPSKIIKKWYNSIKCWIAGANKSRISDLILYSPEENGGWGAPNLQSYFEASQLVRLLELDLDESKRWARFEKSTNEWGHCSRIKEKLDNRSLWYTNELRTMKQARKRLEHRWRRKPDEVSLSAFKAFRRSYESAVMDAKKSYNSSLIASARSCPAQVFKIIRALTSPAPLVQNPATMALTAEALQKFFTYKITVLRQELPPTVDTLNELETLWPLSGPIFDRFTPLDKEDVARILAVAKPTTCSLDPCPSWLVKSCLEGLLDPLSNIINGSLEQGVFPDNLKEARVRPLLKKPSLDPMTLANYHPVSNLQFLGKMIERALLGQLQQFLDDTAGLDPFQSGFRPGHGTEAVLVAITDELRRQSDSGGSALLVLLDITAAFDTVDYDLMIHRLAMSGVCGQALNWFNSFLLNRSQCVEYMDQVSDRSPLLCGVPQGAILSPLLFNIYVRPLASLARSFSLDCYQYSDNTQLLLRLEPGATSIPDNFTLCLEALSNWLRASRLKVNPAKTEILWHGRSTGLTHLLPTFDGAALSPSPTVKSLGVVLDSQLTMEAQVAAASKQAFFHLRQARQLAPYLSDEALATVIHATVTSRLDYFNALYVGLPMSTTRRLRIVQNAAARLLTRTPMKCHITPVLQHLHWLPTDYHGLYKMLVLTFKTLYSQGPSYLRDRLSFSHHRRSQRPSQRDLLYVPGPREVHLERTRRRAFSISAPALWNALPPYMRAMRELGPFTLALKTWLFTRAFNLC